jgi:hypothetical protein
MKTKTLVLTTLLSLASSASLFAQVYSQNVVGYVNASAVSGFNILANPFNTGTNGIAQVIPAADDNTLVYVMQPNGSYTSDICVGNQWFDAVAETPSTTTLSPGQGFFLYAPVAKTFTCVGEISYELIAPNFPAADNMLHYKLNANGQYTSSIYVGGAWYDAVTEAPATVLSAPADALASGFFLYNPDAQTTWTRSYNL